MHVRAVAASTAALLGTAALALFPVRAAGGDAPPRLDAGSWFGPAFAGTRVPTLEQLVRRLERHGQKLLLEIKNPRLYPGIEGETLEALDDEGWLDRAHLRSRLVVQSFSADSVRTVHELEPGVRTGFIGAPPVEDLPGYAGFADQINPPHASLSSGYVTAARGLRGPHGKPLKVFAWTVDDAAAAR
ncbi:glycerophosphodiester phosphodiesterase, partial [Streptomyces prasinopilosus]|uniref:glycerophosphodiester phosphodiesterase n=1 Tax=Streptomyces prasinopilosus TaxID=67344 RepID=UPI0030B8C64C